MRHASGFSAGAPLTLSRSDSAAVYALLGLAMALTVVGVFLGGTLGLPLVTSGWIFLLLLVELSIIFSARLWVHSSPLNYILFAVFPILSGMTITPFVVSILVDYANGAAIILNATIATALLSFGMAIFARTTTFHFGTLGRILFLSLLGLIAFAIIQLFFPSLRGQQAEAFISLVSIVVFALFLGYDIQRVQRAMGSESPFLLALSLYLDIFNMLLAVIRFMAAMGGRRR